MEPVSRTNLALSLVPTVLITGALGFAGYRAHAADRATLRELGARLDRVLAAPAPEPDPELAATRAELERLRERLDGWERAPREAVLVEGAASPDSVQAIDAGSVEADLAEAESAAVDERAQESELAGLIEELAAAGWNFSQLGDRADRFYALAKTGVIERMLDELEADVELAPHDTTLRMQLADGYLAKLMTVSGPEQGRWGGKAETQWKEVVALDENHWRAHSSLGTNYSYYPDVMGKTGEAIQYLGRAVEIQRFEDPRPEHVQSYLFLARMYQRDNRHDDARAALEEGLQRHPNDPALTRALESLAR